jgi:hypothetical protein
MNRKFDIIIMMILITGLSMVLTLVMNNADAIDSAYTPDRTAAYNQDPEWYKYKITVRDADSCLMYGVETWDNVYLGEVNASQLDSIITDHNY